MGHVLGQGRSSLFQDNYNSGYSFGKPYLERVVKSKSSKNESNLASKTSNDEELVKHMSNLPGYLQRVDKDSNIQEKALNFGVLDWKRLEKWKYNERMPAKCPKKSPSSSIKNSIRPLKMDPNLRKQTQSHGVGPTSLSSRFTSPQRWPPQFHSKHLNSLKEGKNVEDIKSKGKETCSQESQPAQSGSIDNRQDSFHQKVQFYERSFSKKNMNDSNKDPRNLLISEEEEGSHDKMIRMSEKKLDEVNFISEPQNTLLLETEKNPRMSCLESSKFTESRTSLDRLSGCFFSDKLSADIPRSCPLPSGGAYHSESTMDPCNYVTPKPIDLNNCTTGAKGRPPSPTRPFSFSLGKIGRSFSYKESPVVAPQSNFLYTPVKSALVRPEYSSSGMDNSDRDKASPARKSSPLRRLLDPLLKNKGPPIGKNPESSTLHALLQVTLKNGLPFFNLVVENSSDMLAAVAKRVPVSGKSDSCLLHTFYSVHEVKKKSMNWISQGSKSKSCGLGYNIVGQMKISNSYYPKVNSTKFIQGDARECVLYGVDQAPSEKQMLEFLPNKEIAAIIVKNLKFNDVKEIEKSGEMMVLLPGGVHGEPIKGAPSSLVSRWRSDGSCDCGGWDVGCKLQILSCKPKNRDVFGVPLPCAPIDRVNLFKQGRDQKSKPVLSLETCNNEFYSIELDTSISLLQAFATCVAYLTCQNFSEILDTKDESKAEEPLPQSIMVTDNMKKTPDTCQGQVPTKYVTCPPLSPVGRV